MRAVEFLGPEGPLANAMQRYEFRRGQLRMAERVEEALEHGGVLLVEAGTGVGKTLAYLVPALLSGLKVVVSTGTRNLQDQIMHQDLPLLERHLGQEVDAVCMKGLANYLCRRRYEEFRKSPESLVVSGPKLKLVDAWQQTSLTGDRAQLGALPEDAPLWAHITSGTDTRIGGRCAYYEECFVTQLRRSAERAQLIVVNHHLLFADLALRGVQGMGVLPEYDAIIFDEAHQIEDVATSFFGVRVSSGGFERLIQDARRSYAAVSELRLPKRELEGILTQASNLFSLVRNRVGVAQVDAARQPLDEDALAGQVREQVHALDNSLEAFCRHSERVGRGEERILQISRRATRMRDALASIVDSRGVERVAWAERAGRGITVGSSPIDVSHILREQLFEPTRSVVLTSATLSADGKFDFIKRRLGLDFEIEEECVSSPFSYPEQALLYLPKSMPDPRSERYIEASLHEVSRLVNLVGGGAFVLCTSYRVMHRLADTLKNELPFPTLVQGDAPKQLLLERFREAGDAVLFATSSFWEGVDVPGAALRLVILDKLPFGVPTDPLIAARCRRLEEEGERSFVRYLVPAAALALKQGFGRLIRTRRDRGIVALLDGRVTTKGYGKIFVRSLPPAQRADLFEEVERFWREGETE